MTPCFTDVESYDGGALGDALNQTFVLGPVAAPIFLVNKSMGDKAGDTPYCLVE